MSGKFRNTQWSASAIKFISHFFLLKMALPTGKLYISLKTSTAKSRLWVAEKTTRKPRNPDCPCHSLCVSSPFAECYNLYLMPGTGRVMRKNSLDQGKADGSANRARPVTPNNMQERLAQILSAFPISHHEGRLEEDAEEISYLQSKSRKCFSGEELINYFKGVTTLWRIAHNKNTIITITLKWSDIICPPMSKDNQPCFKTKWKAFQQLSIRVQGSLLSVWQSVIVMHSTREKGIKKSVQFEWRFLAQTHQTAKSKLNYFKYAWTQKNNLVEWTVPSFSQVLSYALLQRKVLLYSPLRLFKINSGWSK